MTTLQTYLPVPGRILLALIFLLSGYSKITGIDGNIGYMEAFGVPGILIWPTIVLEIVGAIFLIIGFETRWTALALAVFTLISGVIFHSDFGDQNQMIHFLKNLAIIGGLFYVLAYGAGRFSLDARR